MDDDAALDVEDTIVRWARAHRRLMTGLHVSNAAGSDRPQSLLEEAQLMIAIFNSIDRDSFDLMLTQEDGVTVESVSELALPALIERLPQLLGPETDGLNVVLCPIAREVLNKPVLIRLDDLESGEADRIRPYAFLTLETAPRNYQCWVAIARSPAHSIAGLRRQLGLTGAITEAKGEVHLAGSRNVSPEHRQKDGSYPRVALVEARTGLLNTPKQLENAGVTAFLSLGHVC